MIETIEYKKRKYPIAETLGNSAQFAIPFAKHFCKGVGYDIGCNRIEWSLPGSIPIDLNFNNEYDAYNLPEAKVDYIFSSHCLEHLHDWVTALDYWSDHLKSGGVLFLYLPHFSQEYWRPYNNRKHLHSFTTELIIDYMKNRGYQNIFNSEMDLMNSFTVVGEVI